MYRFSMLTSHGIHTGKNNNQFKKEEKGQLRGLGFPVKRQLGLEATQRALFAEVLKKALSVV